MSDSRLDPVDGRAAPAAEQHEAPTLDGAAVSFVTTEHFTLQGARSQTISESTGRASIFLEGEFPDPGSVAAETLEERAMR